jgi:hypothetical protein
VDPPDLRASLTFALALGFALFLPGVIGVPRHDLLDQDLRFVAARRVIRFAWCPEGEPSRFLRQPGR